MRCRSLWGVQCRRRVANKEAKEFAAANDNWLHSLSHSQECKKYIAEKGENVAYADELFIPDRLGYLYVRGNQGQNFKKSRALSICYNSAKEMAVRRA